MSLAKKEILKAISEEKGYRKKNGTRLTIQNLTHMLSNKKYIGVYHYKDIEVEGGCPAVIDKNTFDKVQEKVIYHKEYFDRKR